MSTCLLSDTVLMAFSMDTLLYKHPLIEAIMAQSGTGNCNFTGPEMFLTPSLREYQRFCCPPQRDYFQ